MVDKQPIPAPAPQQEPCKECAGTGGSKYPPYWCSECDGKGTTPEAPPQPAPAAEWLEQAYREGWAACRDAETIGQEAEDWAFGNSTANSRMIDMQQAAPSGDAARIMFDAGWKACARFCGREDAAFDGIVGKTGCPEFEAAFNAAYKEQGN